MPLPQPLNPQPPPPPSPPQPPLQTSYKVWYDLHPPAQPDCFCVCVWMRERRIDRQQLARPDKILSLIMRGPCPIWDQARAGPSSQRCRCHMSELAPFTILSNFSPVRSFSGVILSGSGAVSRPVWCGDYRTPFMFPVGWQWRQSLCGQEEPGSSVYMFGFLIYRANHIRLHRYNDTKIMFCLFHYIKSLSMLFILYYNLVRNSILSHL